MNDYIRQTVKAGKLAGFSECMVNVIAYYNLKHLFTPLEFKFCVSGWIRVKICGDLSELLESGFEVFDDFLGERFGIGKMSDSALLDARIFSAAP